MTLPIQLTLSNVVWQRRSRAFVLLAFLTVLSPQGARSQSDESLWDDTDTTTPLVSNSQWIGSYEREESISSENEPAVLDHSQQVNRSQPIKNEGDFSEPPEPRLINLAQLTSEIANEATSESLPLPVPASLNPTKRGGQSGGLPTTPEPLIEIRDQTLPDALDFLAQGASVSFMVSEKASEIEKVSLHLKNVSLAEALNALVNKYDLDFYPSSGGQLIHIRLRSEVKQDISDPGYRERLKRLYADLEREINATFPDSLVRLTVVGQQVVVRGEAKDVLEAEQIINLVSRNAPSEGKKGKSITAQITKSIFGPAGGAQSVSASGPASDLFSENLSADPPTVINMLQVVGEQQVMLRVTVAEVNRSAARSIGLSFNVQNDAGTNVLSSLFTGLGTIGTTGMATGFIPGASANMPATLDGGQVSLAINALRQLNLARTLAEPNLTALNGRTATFRAGGRFPVPVVAADSNNGLQGVRFEEFGVLLEFMPFIIDRDRIRLKILAEVSVRDNDLGANIGGDAAAGGTSVPGINERSFETTVELRDGQTLAVAGLLQNEYVADATRVPFWGDLPLIGRTGAFDQAASREQELVILITPELVHPLKACETMPLPGGDIFEPSDVEFYLHGRLESRRTEDFRSAARTDHAKQLIYEECENRMLIGPAGYSCSCGDACEIETR